MKIPSVHSLTGERRWGYSGTIQGFVLHNPERQATEWLGNKRYALNGHVYADTERWLRARKKYLKHGKVGSKKA